MSTSVFFRKKVSKMMFLQGFYDPRIYLRLINLIISFILLLRAFSRLFLSIDKSAPADERKRELYNPRFNYYKSSLNYEQKSPVVLHESGNAYSQVHTVCRNMFDYFFAYLIRKIGNEMCTNEEEKVLFNTKCFS